jgi:CRISPR/Cas system-associated endonuclease/helicase Cas3
MAAHCKPKRQHYQEFGNSVKQTEILAKIEQDKRCNLKWNPHMVIFFLVQKAISVYRSLTLGLTIF